MTMTTDAHLLEASSADGERLLDEGERLFVASLRGFLCSRPHHNPLEFGYLVLHPSAECYADARKRGASHMAKDFVLLMCPREAVASQYGVPPDEILCVVAISGAERVLGFPLSVLFEQHGVSCA
jgi:hypothetical protein